RRALARALEAGPARGAPREDVAVRIGNGHDCVVEARLDIGVSARHVLAFATADARSLRASGGSSFGHTSGLLLRAGLLAAGDSLAWAFASARIGARALAMSGQTAAVAYAAVAVDFHQPLDVQVQFATQITFDRELAVHDLA